MRPRWVAKKVQPDPTFSTFSPYSYKHSGTLSEHGVRPVGVSLSIDLRSSVNIKEIQMIQVVSLI